VPEYNCLRGIQPTLPTHHFLQNAPLNINAEPSERAWRRTARRGSHALFDDFPIQRRAGSIRCQAILEARETRRPLAYEPNPMGLESARSLSLCHYARSKNAFQSKYFSYDHTIEAYSYVFRRFAIVGRRIIDSLSRYTLARFSGGQS